MLKADINSSTDLNPYDLVERIASDNPAADLVHIQRLVRRALSGPDAEYTDAFIDQTTERMLRRYLAREAEKHTNALRPSAKPTLVPTVSSGVSSEKFSVPVRPYTPSIATTPRLDPQRRAPAEPAAYSTVTPKPLAPAHTPLATSPQISSVVIPERRIKVSAPAPLRKKERMQEAPDVANISLKRARAFLVGSLLKLLMPNGKPLGDCTLRECEQIGTYFSKAIRAAAPKHAPLDAPVSLYFTDEKLRAIQTWTNDVYAD